MPSSFSLDVLSLVLIVSLAQGLFIMAVLIIRYRLKPEHYVLLLALIVMLFWLQAEFLAVRNASPISMAIFYGNRHGAWLALGPLYYYYAASVLKFPIRGNTLLLHLAPFLIFTILIPIAAGNFLGFHQVHYGMVSPFYPINRHVTFLQGIYTAVFILQYIHFFLYLVFSFRLVRAVEQDARATYSSIGPSLKWLRLVTMGLVIALLFATAFLVLFFWVHSYNRTLDYLYVLPMALLIYLVAFKLAGVEWNRSAGAIRYEKSSLRLDEAADYRSKLEAHMQSAKPYLNNELRLQDLAQALDIPAHHLSQVINGSLDASFFDYINRHRVAEAVTLIRTNPSTPLLEIGFQAGFNNKNSFTNAFKRFTGKTPQAFKNSEKITRL